MCTNCYYLLVGPISAFLASVIFDISTPTNAWDLYNQINESILFSYIFLLAPAVSISGLVPKSVTMYIGQ